MSDTPKNNKTETNPWDSLLRELCDSDEDYERVRKEGDERAKEEERKRNALVINDDDTPEMKNVKQQGQAVIDDFKEKMQKNLLNLTSNLEKRGYFSKEKADKHRRDIYRDLGDKDKKER